MRFCIVIIMALVYLFPMCMHANEARKILHEKNPKIMNKVPPYMSNPTTGIGDISSSTDHIDVSSFLRRRRRLLKTPVNPSGPNPPTWIPPKSQNHKDPPLQGSMETSKTKGSNPIP